MIAVVLCILGGITPQVKFWRLSQRRIWVAVYGDCSLSWRVRSTLGLTVVPMLQGCKESKNKTRGVRKA